jgi:hypothetical protein
MLFGSDGNQGVIETSQGSPGFSNSRLLINYGCGADVFVGNQNSGALVAKSRLGVRTEDFGANGTEFSFRVSGLSLFDSPVKVKNNAGEVVFGGWPSYGNGDFITINGTDPKINFRENNSKGSLGYTNGALRLISEQSIRIFLNADQSGGGSSDLIIAGNCDHDSPNCDKLFWLTEGGKLGLGCDPNSTELQQFLLAVNGNIRARKVKVDNSTQWGDYVFQDDFKLPTIEEMQDFVMKNGHLPGFKSASEYRSEGIDLEEVIAQQQVMIEILFLHVKNLKMMIDEK